jgi:hypothetical protein
VSAPPARPRKRAQSPASIDSWRREAAASQERAFAARLEADRRAHRRALARRVLAVLLAACVLAVAYVLVTGALT